MTTKHFTEAELLETYYLQPGESMPVMMHLADCRDCAARYERLERKLRESASCERERPETFWKRQRIAITRTIAAQNQQHAAKTRTFRVAAAAMLAFFLGGAVVYKSLQPQIAHPAQTMTANATVTAPPPAHDDVLEHDPWQSDELRDFHNVVQWESWVADSKTSKKGSSSL